MKKEPNWTVRFDQTYYHKKSSINLWCEANLSSYLGYREVFGHTDYYFDDKADMITFNLVHK